MKLVLEHPFMMLDSAPDSIVKPVKEHLRFSRHLQSLAGTIVSNLSAATSSDTFNGLHLRVETDAVNFANNVGGVQFSCISGSQHCVSLILGC